MSENEIGIEGAKSFAAMLERNTTLTALDISENEMGIESAKSLAATLERNTTSPPSTSARTRSEKRERRV